MSSRALRYLLVLLAALAALYAFITLDGASDSERPASPLADAFVELQAADLERIEIRGPAEDNVALQLTETGWTVNGFSADSTAVQRLLTATGAARAGDRLSRNPANHARLGVDADSAWQVAFWTADGAKSTILLGKPGPSFNSVYVRLPEQNDVFLATGDLRAAAARPLEEWRDKLIARVDTAAVDVLHLWRNDTSYSVSRSDSVWTLVELESLADPGALADLLGELADLRSTGFFADDLAASAGAGEPALRLMARGDPTDTLLELDAVERDAAYQIRVGGDSIVYQLPSWRVDRLIPALERLAPTTAPDSGRSN